MKGVFDGQCGVDLDHGVAWVNTGKPEGLSGINKMVSLPTKTK